LESRKNQETKIVSPGKTNKKKHKVVNEETQKKKRKTHCFQKEDHLKLENLKIETRGGYFRGNNKYADAICESCGVEIKTVSVKNQVHCCVHEGDGCYKCVCKTYITVIVKDPPKMSRRVAQNF